jgi:hypothetical protein
MFIRVKHNKDTCYYYLCKTERTGHSVHQTIVEYFGKVVPNEYQHMLKTSQPGEAQPTQTIKIVIPVYTEIQIKELEEAARQEIEWLREEFPVQNMGD